MTKVVQVGPGGMTIGVGFDKNGGVTQTYKGNFTETEIPQDQLLKRLKELSAAQTIDPSIFTNKDGEIDGEKLAEVLKGLNLGDAPPPPYSNMPADYEAALARIIELECNLEDLARGFEIADSCGMYHMVNSYVEAANSSLASKMVKQHEESEFKINRVVKDKTDESDDGTFKGTGGA